MLRCIRLLPFCSSRAAIICGFNNKVFQCFSQVCDFFLELGYATAFLILEHHGVGLLLENFTLGGLAMRVLIGKRLLCQTDAPANQNSHQKHAFINYFWCHQKLHVIPLAWSTNAELEKITTNVVPLIIDSGKVALLVESMALAIHFKASDKFNISHLIVDAAVLRCPNA